MPLEARLERATSVPRGLGWIWLLPAALVGWGLATLNAVPAALGVGLAAGVSLSGSV